MSHSDTLRFSESDPDLPIVTLTNHTRRPCFQGNVDGCWVKNIKASPGDSVMVQIKCRNYNENDVNDILVGFQAHISESGKSILINGGVKKGNKKIAEDNAIIFVSAKNGFSILPNSRIYPSPFSEGYFKSIKIYNGSTGVNLNMRGGDNQLIQFWLVINK